MSIFMRGLRLIRHRMAVAALVDSATTVQFGTFGTFGTKYAVRSMAGSRGVPSTASIIFGDKSVQKIEWPGIPFPVPAELRVVPPLVYHNATRVAAHQALGTLILGMETDGVTLAVDWREQLVGDPETGALMGGVVTTMLDHATGLSILMRTDGEVWPGGTLDLRLDYLRPSTRGERLLVQSQCHRLSRHVAFVRGKAWHASRPDDVIAHATGTYAVDRTSVPDRIFNPQIGGGADIPNVTLSGVAALPLTVPFPEVVAQARATRDFTLLVKTIPYFAFLGLDVREEGGTLITRLPGWEQHVGNYRARLFHGGVTGALLEAAAMLQLLSNDTVHVAKTISFTTDYLRGAQLTDLHARAIVVRLGRRIANVRCEAWQDDPARPVAVAHGNFLLT